MIKAYSYARFSSAKQAEGDSLRRQLTAAIAYAETHNLDLDTSLQDLGVSGYSGANREKGALRSFLRMVEDGLIPSGSFLLIDSMDRLSRLPVVQASHQLLGIALAGIRVVTLNDGRVFDEQADVAEMVMAVAEMSRSHRESAEKGRKVAQAHANSKRRAREEGRIWNRTGPGWLRYDDASAKFVTIPERVAVVARIYSMMLDHGMGCRVIAQRLNADGVEPFKGGAQWHDTTVAKLLRSRAILGDYQPRFADGSPDGEPALGYYGEPIIDPALYHRVQATMDGNRGKRGRRQGSTELRNLFSGLTRCGECGGPMIVHRRSKDQVDLFQCYSMGMGKCANRKRTKVVAFEAVFLHAVTDLDLSPKSELGAKERALTIALAERDALQARVSRLLDALEEGGSVMERYRERQAELDVKLAEIATLKASMEQRAVALTPRDHQSAIAALLAQLQGLEGAKLYDARSRIAVNVKAIVDRLAFYENGLVVIHVLGGAKVYVIRDGVLSLSVDNTQAILATPEIVADYTLNDPKREVALQAMRNRHQ